MGGREGREEEEEEEGSWNEPRAATATPPMNQLEEIVEIDEGVSEEYDAWMAKKEELTVE